MKHQCKSTKENHILLSHHSKTFFTLFQDLSEFVV